MKKRLFINRFALCLWRTDETWLLFTWMIPIMRVSARLQPWF